eukprot:g1997.t1
MRFGNGGYHENLAVTLSQKYDLAFDVAQHLVRNYGTRAGQVLDMVDQDTVKGSRSGLYKHYRRLYEGAAATTGYPYLEAEVRYAVNHEYAVTPADAGIAKAAAELGFPLSQDELQKAVSEMDTDKNGEVHFPEFLAWWNSSEKSQGVHQKIFMGTRRGSRWKTIEE